MRDEKIHMDMVKREEEEEDKGAFPFSWDPLPPIHPSSNFAHSYFFIPGRQTLTQNYSGCWCLQQLC
jgi:hypothetical protein